MFRPVGICREDVVIFTVQISVLIKGGMSRGWGGGGLDFLIMS